MILFDRSVDRARARERESSHPFFSFFPPIQYFPEAQAGPIAGKIRLRPEELAFTLKALTAAGKELSDYLTSFPPDMVKQLMEEIYKA